MGKHAIPGQKWAYSAEQVAKLLTNEGNTRYRQGQLDALVAVSRLQQGHVSTEQFQALLEALPHTWDQSYDGAYVVGFEDMYGALCEHLTTVYAPEVHNLSEDATHGSALTDVEVRIVGDYKLESDGTIHQR